MTISCCCWVTLLTTPAALSSLVRCTSTRRHSLLTNPLPYTLSSSQLTTQPSYIRMSMRLQTGKQRLLRASCGSFSAASRLLACLCLPLQPITQASSEILLVVLAGVHRGGECCCGLAVALGSLQPSLWTKLLLLLLLLLLHAQAEAGPEWLQGGRPGCCTPACPWLQPQQDAAQRRQLHCRSCQQASRRLQPAALATRWLYWEPAP